MIQQGASWIVEGTEDGREAVMLWEGRQQHLVESRTRNTYD